MIKFFRKIRYDLMGKNTAAERAGKTVQYLKYALGEIILVVVGILIALSINNWNGIRKERIAEQTLYHTLISSLESDLEDANDKISSVEVSIKAQEIFIVSSFEEVKNTYDIDQLESLLTSVGASSRSFFPNYGLYDRISDNNQIDLIRSAELQMQIIELYEQYYKRYNDIDLNLEQLVVFGIGTNYFNKIEDEFIKNNGHYRIGFETLKRDYDILNSECRKIYNMTREAHSSMIECRNEIISLLSLLEKEVQ